MDRRVGGVIDAALVRPVPPSVYPRPQGVECRRAPGVVADRGGRAREAIQAQLGHASIVTTLDIYGHLLLALSEQVVSALDAAHESRGGNVVELAASGE